MLGVTILRQEKLTDTQHNLDKLSFCKRYLLLNAAADGHTGRTIAHTYPKRRQH
jgi:hypothetical protein